MESAFPMQFAENDLDAAVPARFEQVAQRHAHKVAVKSGHRAWSYLELNQAANRVAHALLAAMDAHPAPVALLMVHDAPVIAAILGVLKAGKFYASLDASYPLPHNKAVVADLKPALMICDRANEATALELTKGVCPIRVYETIEGAYSSENPGVPLTAEAPFAVFYTSGSTGKPKGVQWKHRLALLRVLADTRDSALSPDDRQALLTSFTFVGSSSDSNRALLTGASLHLYNARERGTAHLAYWLRKEEITYFRPPLALFRQFLASLHARDAFPSVRVISLGGAALYRRDIENTRRHFSPACRIVHRYSTSETGLVARLVIGPEMRLEEAVVPVGHVAPGKEVLILDEKGEALPANSVGEIAVRSRDLSTGYWREADEDRTPFSDRGDEAGVLYRTGDLGRLRTDGCLEFLGRRDLRIKIRGFRVEIAAVEAALRELDGVADVAVTVVPDAAGEPSLAAYVRLDAGPAPRPGALRRALAARLPEHMLPSAFVFLDALPLTRSGKVDRRALAHPASNDWALTRDGRSPRNAIEAELAAIWSDVLKVDAIGPNDDFFDLGGHSLLAARVIARVNQQFRLNLLLRALYEAPTLAGLALLIETARFDANRRDVSVRESHSAQDTLRLLGLS